MAGGSFARAAGNDQIPNNLFQPDIWSLKMLARYYEESVVPSIVNLDYEGEIKTMGDRVRIRREVEVPVSQYFKGMTLLPQDITDEEAQLLIDKGFYYNVPVADIDKRQTDVPWVAGLQKNAIKQLSRKVDEVVLGAVYADADSGNQLADRALSPNNIPDLIVEAGVALDDSFAPEEDRFIVVPFWFKGHLKLNPTFVSAEKMGDKVSIIRNGYVGEWDRMKVHCTKWLGTSGGFTQIIFGCRTAITFATQFVEHETLRNPNDFGDLIRGLQVFGYKTVQSTHLGKVGVTKA